MNEQRRQILEMLAEGKINADEAERLIAALERGAPAPTQDKGTVKYLRIDRANGALERAGVAIDLSKLKPEQIEELIDHLDEMTIDVEDADSTVHVFCE